MKQRRGVRVVRQRKEWDCGVACLAMLLNRPYGDVAALVRETVDPRKLRRRGLVIAEMCALAERFRVELTPVYRQRGYLRNNGILGMNGGEMSKAGHWVVLKSGPGGSFIVDPDGGESWDVFDYIDKHKCRPATLLKRIT